MTLPPDPAPPPEARPPLAEPLIRRRRRVSPVWAIPIVAALIALWLGYRTLSEEGPSVTITFETADGLEAGKTRVKHNNVELGVLETVALSPDLSKAVATVRMTRSAADHLRQGTRFWVVRPRFSVSSLSGLETLVSGAYIEMDPGPGAPARAFTGLEVPPVVRSDVAGRAFILRTAKLGSLSAGSPVFYRGVRVGEVLGYDFTGIERDIAVHAFVRAPFDRLVHDRTRFWNASGISFNAGSQGFHVEIESLQALIGGGIAFETPRAALGGEPAADGAVFPLYDNRESVQDAPYTVHAPYLVEFTGSVHGLEVGAPVEFRGVKVGSVTDIHLEYDPKGNIVRVPVTVELERQRIEMRGNAAAIPPGQQLTEELIKHGMRAQLRSANLLTGQLLVALDIFPNAPPAELVQTSTHPQIPTVPTELETLTSSVSGILDRLAALPLQQLVEDARKTMQSLQGLADTPEIRESLKSLNKTLIAAEALVHDANAQTGPLIASLRKAADAADQAFQRAGTTLASVDRGYGNDSQARRDLADLMRQFQDAARSVRLLADYLEQHPEALVRGKTGNVQ